MYPLTSVTKVYPDEIPSSTNESDTNFFKAAANSIATDVYNIANKLIGYENNNTNTKTQINNNTNEQ